MAVVTTMVALSQSQVNQYDVRVTYEYRSPNQLNVVTNTRSTTANKNFYKAAVQVDNRVYNLPYKDYSLSNYICTIEGVSENSPTGKEYAIEPTSEQYDNHYYDERGNYAGVVIVKKGRKVLFSDKKLYTEEQLKLLNIPKK